MFESEEVDDDYFTPVAKTSLASIFKKPASGEKLENETLKYTPPVLKPPQNQGDSQKPYENLFSSVFDAYLWLDNVYTHKGKLGCAVVKHNSPSQSFHSILLYDSKRATVSSAIATHTLQVTVKGKDIISYYDRYEKYWYLRGSNEDVKKIVDLLKTCNVIIKVLNEEDNSLPQQNEAKENDNTNKKIIESDTDSSINRKTKASILNRMASMGQSVLPLQAVSIESSSDSEDDHQIIAVKHKHIKNIAKKTESEQCVSEHQKTDVHKAIVPTAQTKNSKSCVELDNQLQFQSSTLIPVATTAGNELNFFFTEQRISNSELRINMARISDKVDNILDKVNNLEKDKHEESTMNNIILQKLLHEYEEKIKSYEELIQKLNKNTDFSKKELPIDMAENNKIVNKLNNKLTELDNCIKQKDGEIFALNNEVKTLKETNSSQSSKEIENDLRAKISEYEDVINKHNEMMSRLTTKKDELLTSHNDQIEHKIKSIMNETFQTIEINFDKNETYTGEAIKTIIGTIIKKVTIESLNNL